MEFPYTSMQTKTDCGPVLLGNLLGPILGINPTEVRDDIVKTQGFPNNESMRDDLWDNPGRHKEVIKHYVGSKGLELRVVPQSYTDTPCGVLLRKNGSPLSWHWVLFAGVDRSVPEEPGYFWHSGAAIGASQVNTFYPRYWAEVLRYTVAAPSVGTSLPWYWRVWRQLVRLAGV